MLAAPFIRIRFSRQAKAWLVFVEGSTMPILFFTQRQLPADSSSHRSILLLYKRLRSFGLI